MSFAAIRKKEALAGKLYYEELLEKDSSPETVRRHPRERNGLRRAARAGAGLILVFTLMVIAYLSVCTRIVEEQYALDRCQAELPALSEEYARLEIQVKSLSSLSRIDAIARNSLHMVYPKDRLMILEDPVTAKASSQFYAWRAETGEKIVLP